MPIEEGTPWQHKTVLLHEAVQALVHKPQGTYLDATYGRGGHSRAILAALAPTGRLIAIDRDPQAMVHATSPATAPADARFAFVHTTMSRLPSVLAEQGVQQLDGVLMDLGVSSPQIDDPSRGFSFRHDGPLDMRMDPTRGESAASYLAAATEAEMTEVLREYGEERFAAAIARAIVARRAAGQPIERTAELAELCARAVRTREPGQDPATRTFQALRIRVNGELDELRAALEGAASRLAPQGRLAVISFHSLEDRIVKSFIAQRAHAEVDRRVPMAAAPEPLLLPLARVRPGEEEVRDNPRARSAILRVAERTAAPWRAQATASGRPARGGRGSARAGGGRVASAPAAARLADAASAIAAHASPQGTGEVLP